MALGRSLRRGSFRFDRNVVAVMRPSGLPGWFEPSTVRIRVKTRTLTTATHTAHVAAIAHASAAHGAIHSSMPLES